MSLVNALTMDVKEIGPYNKLILRILGMTVPPQRQQEVQIILQAHLFFLQSQAKHAGICTNELYDGGFMNIFDLMDDISDAFQNGSEESVASCFHLLSSIRPNCLNAKLAFERALTKQVTDLYLKQLDPEARNNLKHTLAHTAQALDHQPTIPTKELRLHFSKSKIAHYLSKHNITIDQIFKKLDSQRKGYIRPEAFVDFIK